MEMLKVALLGEGDVFLGEADIAAADFDPARHVRAEDYGGACDNEPERYYWDRAAKTFRPVLNDWDRDFGMLVQHAITLAAAHVGEAGELGDGARMVYAIAAKRFPRSLAVHAARGN